MPDTWTALIVTADVEVADSLASFLIDQGAPGTASEDLPDGRIRITAHFAGDPPVDPFERFCANLGTWFPAARHPEVRCQSVSNEDWADSWKAHFPPLLIGERLFVHPPWIDDVPDGRLGIVLNPGTAFGTGHHATTRGCLVLLEQVLREQGDRRVLDLGTGSGILAIAAAKLGCTDVVAIDTDADARSVAAENARANEVASVIAFDSSLASADGKFGVILANLFARQLIEFAPDICGLLEDRGFLIGAGILVDEVDPVIDAWRGEGLTVDLRNEESEWVTLRARRA